MGRWWRRRRAGSERGPASPDHGLPGGREGGDAEQAPAPKSSAERSPPEPSDQEPTRALAGSTTAMASVADRINTILEAAEATAAAIRHEAKADAERAARERRRRDEARDELSHLSRLADALSVQAEAVSRQCDIVARVLLPPEDDASAAAEAVEGSSTAVEATRGARPDAAPESGPPAASDRAPGSSPAAGPGSSPGPGPAAAGETASPDPPPRAPLGGPSDEPSSPATATVSNPSPRSPETEIGTPSARSSADLRPASDGNPAGGERLPSPWVEAYRMRLAGAEADEVEAHLRRTGADDPSKVVAEVFRDELPDRP